MKYEITKGSEKDFEDAPESATVRIIESGFEDRFPIFADKFENCSTRTHCATGVYDSYIADVSNWSIIAERRPITEPVVNQQLTAEWDGEGLPPVGSTFDMRLKPNGLWLETKLIAAGQEQIIYFREGMEFSGHKNNYEFRPICSPEDVARDEATKAMNEVWREHAGKEHNGKLFSIYEIIYEGIAAGKIPGVKLE